MISNCFSRTTCLKLTQTQVSYFEWQDKKITLTTILVPEVNAVDGAVGAAPQNVSGGEAMLDLDIAYALIYPQKINYIPVDDEYYQTNYYYDVGA